MYVSRLKVRGFRGIKSAEIVLGRHCVLVGANNAGKTTIIDAISLVLGRGDLRHRLFEYDFYGGSPTPSSRITITAVITGFDSNNPADYPDLFHHERGGVPMWWDTSDTMLHVEPENGRLLAVEVGFCARFDDELLEDEYLPYFVEDDGDPFLEEDLRRVRRGFIRDVGLFLVPARRTWDALWSFRSSLFRKVLESEKAVPGRSIRLLRDSLRQPSSRLEDEQPFTSLVQRLNRELDAFLRPETAELCFRPTAGDTPAVLDSIVPHVQSRAGIHLPIGHHGSGVVSLQTLLLLMEFGRRRREADDNFILAAEEPELHLHPGQHRRLVGRIRGVASQSIVTTHSPQIASFYRPSEILVVHTSRDGVLTAQPLLAPDERPERNPLIRLFTLYRAEVCEAVMNDVVVVPEGKTDFRWLRGLALESITAEGWDPTATEQAALPLGVLPTQSSSIIETVQMLMPAVPRLLPLLDGDVAGRQYIKRLRQLTSSPKRVVRWKNEWTIEDVVAWVLNAEDMNLGEVKHLLLDTDITPATLASSLRSDSLKSRWDQQEILAGLVGTSVARATRARRFLNGLAHIGLGTEPDSLFIQDARLSTAETEVWIFDPEGE